MPVPLRSRYFAAIRAGLLALISATATSAFCAAITLNYDTFVETKLVAAPLSSASPIRLDGSLRNLALTGAAINNTFRFTAGSTSASLSAGWLIGPPDNRTVGFNIDIFDAGNNLVASDTFLGTSGTLASSQLTATGLIPGGLYRMIVTGTAVTALGRFQIDLVDGNVPPPVARAGSRRNAIDKRVCLRHTHGNEKSWIGFHHGHAGSDRRRDSGRSGLVDLE